MGISIKMVAKEILMAGLKRVPLAGDAFDVVDNIAKSHETLRLQQRLQEIERGMTSFDRNMRDLVKSEIEQTVLGLARRDLSGPDFTHHIKNLYDIRNSGWSPALFQGLLQNSAHWDELCKNPSHYGSVLSDRQPLDPSKLHVFIDADKTRILELRPFALHGLLADQRDDTIRSKIVTSTDVWALVDTGTPSQPGKPIAVAVPAERVKKSGVTVVPVTDYAKWNKYVGEQIAEAARAADLYDYGTAISLLERLLSKQPHNVQVAEWKEKYNRLGKLWPKIASDMLQMPDGDLIEHLEEILVLQPSHADAQSTLDALGTPAERTQKKWSHGKVGRPKPNSLGMQFAWVPHGDSWLGGGDGKPGTAKFALPRPGLWCGVYPVTQAEWQAVMGTDPSHFKGNPRYPVESVSWNEVQEFIKKLNQRTGADGLVYRLPTEQEWEYICRGGPITQDQSKYHFYFARSKDDLTPVLTNDLCSTQANFNGNYPAGSAAKGPYLERTSEVGLYLPNPLGICDLHGQVWEWTSSTYEGSHRVFRGGSWRFHGVDCTAASRYWDDPDYRDHFVGFRLLAVPSGKK